MARQVQIKRNEIPDGWSLEGADFINKVNWFSIMLKLTYLIYTAYSKKTNQ